MSELGALTLVATLVVALSTTAAAQEATLQDPLQPPGSAQTEAPAQAAPRPFRLSAVLISSSRRVAVVNGEIRREGDRVAGATVARIEPRQVTLSRGGEDIVVRLPGSDDEIRIRSGDDSR